MKKNQLTLSGKDVMYYCSKNQYATMRFFEASNDYLAARCLILNGILLPGLGSACQAIEKVLKAFIYLETKEKLKTGHNPFKLKEKLKESVDYKLDKYDSLLSRLYEHYQQRYYDSPTSWRRASSKELDEIDDLWVKLIGALPMPDEVKHRMLFFCLLLDDEMEKYQPISRHWLTINNKSLIPKIPDMKKRHKEVLKHLYPNK